MREFPSSDFERDLQNKFELVFHKLQLRLNPSDPLQADLLGSVVRLGQGNIGDWSRDRNEVVSSARTLFDALWTSIELKHRDEM